MVSCGYLISNLWNEAIKNGYREELAPLHVTGSKWREDTIFAAISPGRFSNLELMDPLSNDSDEDGMLDGWEVKYGLDPTNPWDGLQDTDGDGVNLDDDPIP